MKGETWRREKTEFGKRRWNRKYLLCPSGRYDHALCVCAQWAKDSWVTYYYFLELRHINMYCKKKWLKHFEAFCIFIIIFIFFLTEFFFPIMAILIPICKIIQKQAKREKKTKTNKKYLPVIAVWLTIIVFTFVKL